MTCTPTQPQPTPTERRVPVQPFQVAVGRKLDDPDFSWGEVCRRLGWMQVKPDSSRLKRTLGLQETGNGYFQKTVNYDTALELCRALDLDPVDVGL